MAWAQNPRYHNLADHSSLPSTYIYNLAQDPTGNLWLGTNTGLYRFDGIRYEQFENENQQVKSVAGLVYSPSGRLYVYSFHGKLFYYKNNKLHYVNYPFKKIYNLVSNPAGGIIITHLDGISKFNEENNTVTPFRSGKKTATRAAKITPEGKLFFTQEDRIYWIHIDGSGQFQIPAKYHTFDNDYFLETIDEDLYLFNSIHSKGFIFRNNLFSPISSELDQALAGKKITNIRHVRDGFLWIYTYNGVVRYDTATGKVDQWFEDKTISDGIVDREGSIWLSVFHEGAYRIPHIDVRIWNSNPKSFQHKHINTITRSDNAIFLSHLSGDVSIVGRGDKRIGEFSTGSNSDNQSFDWNPIEKEFTFQQNNFIHTYKADKWTKYKSPVNAVKASIRMGNSTILGSSFGLFNMRNQKVDTINIGWIRALAADTLTLRVWAASNKGLLDVRKKGDQWVVKRRFIENTSITDIIKDPFNDLYVVDANGVIYKYDALSRLNRVTQLPKNAQANKIKVHKKQLYLATNAGVYIWDLEKKAWNILNQKNYLISDNVYDIEFFDFKMWLATAKGVQTMPMDLPLLPPRAQLMLSDEKSTIDPTLSRKHPYKQPLIFYPHLAHLSSGTNYQYAYRILPKDSTWVTLPSNIKQIRIANLPIGKCTIEVKAIDFLGRDSENHYVLYYDILPPFWRTITFYILIAVLALAGLYLLFKRYKQLKKRRLEELSELNKAKLTALKTKINPLMVVELLDKVEQLIGDNHAEKAKKHVQKLNQLIEQTITHSQSDYIAIADEIHLIELYLQLETLRQNKEIQYEINRPSNHLDLYIPTMLIIPVLEEIINNNRSCENNKLTLQIDFSFTSFFECHITVNGHNSEQSQDKFVQLLREAITQRMAILKQMNPNEYSVFCKTLQQQDEVTGVKVYLRMPSKLK